jgi:tetratricopeptide (TPR) repeat protein
MLSLLFLIWDLLLWRTEIDRGIRHLSQYRPEAALKCFYKALNSCPVSRKKELSRLLFYLGVTLNRLGFLDCAIKSWLASQRLNKFRYSLKMIERFANTYGMERQSCVELDDWKAFFSIQVARYLRSKKTRRFSCEAERDMIRDLISDYWKDLKRQGKLNLKSPEEKNRLFKSVTIVFPFVLLKDGKRDSLIHIDFRQNRKVVLDDRCSCGSGLSFMVCCGRTPGEVELLGGFF